MGITVGVMLGALLTPVSGGTSLAVALPIMSVVTVLPSCGVTVTQQFMEKLNSIVTATLGWVILGAGIVSGLSSAVPIREAPL